MSSALSATGTRFVSCWRAAHIAVAARKFGNLMVFGCWWFLNNPSKTDGTGGTLPFPSAPRSAITFQGNGVNMIYLDQENDLLMVVRWIDRGHVEPFLRLIVESVKG